ncbi:MAG: 6-bladed beta-propeller, partial [Candidatus Aminicenantes bacterium]|nr:6-bladed beta-propeller [Candidatus Aminicenantes bacterium]
MKKYVIYLFLFGICFFLSCGQSPVEKADKPAEKSLQPRFDESLFSVELRDGIRNVHNQSAQWRDAQKLKLEPVLTIGELDGMDENVLFHKPYEFAVAPDGSIAIVDAGNFRIQKFSPKGEFLASFGRKGQGPGEFQMMGGIAIDEQGRMYIADLNTNTIKVFSSVGVEEKQIPVFRHKGPVLRLPTGHFVLGNRMNMGSDIVPALIHIFNGEGKEEASIGEVQRHEDFDEYRYFNRVSYTADEEGSFYLAYGTRNLIEKYDFEGN